MTFRSVWIEIGHVTLLKPQFPSPFLLFLFREIVSWLFVRISQFSNAGTGVVERLSVRRSQDKFPGGKCPARINHKSIKQMVLKKQIYLKYHTDIIIVKISYLSY